MTTFDSQNSLTKIYSSSFRTNHEHFCELFGHGYILLSLVDCTQTRSKKKLRKNDSSMMYIVIVLQGGANHGLNTVCGLPRNLSRTSLIGRNCKHARRYTWWANQYRETAQHRDGERAFRGCLYEILVPAFCGIDVARQCHSVTRYVDFIPA
jgi:hypothetical protein